MALRVLLVICMLATVAPAAVKRDDFSSSQTSSVSSGSVPVYSSPASGSSNSFSTPVGVQYSGSNQPQQYQANVGQDHQVSASNNNFQSQPANQGNLYYYYYPVQEKPKDGQFQAAASNQYSSSIPASSVSQDGSSSSGHLDTAASSNSAQPSDLSYSAQDLTYSAQALNPGLSDYSGSAQASGNYDQTLSSLASQLSQYGQAAQAYQTQGNNAVNYNGQQQPGQQQYQQQQYSYDPAHSNIQEQAGQFSASNPIPNYGVNPNQATFIPANQAVQGQVPVAFNPAAAYAQYQGQMPFGNFGAGSVPASSYEPAAAGYRRYGIGSFIMPMLALAGLSLLIPTVTSLTASGRKKRSTGDVAKESALVQYFDRLERYYSLFKTANEREECMNRIICELGGAASEARAKNPLFS